MLCVTWRDVTSNTSESDLEGSNFSLLYVVGRMALRERQIFDVVIAIPLAVPVKDALAYYPRGEQQDVVVNVCRTCCVP
jgi:hypothetical protein